MAYFLVSQRTPQQEPCRWIAVQLAQAYSESSIEPPYPQQKAVPLYLQSETSRGLPNLLALGFPGPIRHADEIVHSLVLLQGWEQDVVALEVVAVAVGSIH